MPLVTRLLKIDSFLALEYNRKYTFTGGPGRDRNGGQTCSSIVNEKWGKTLEQQLYRRSSLVKSFRKCQNTNAESEDLAQAPQNLL